MRLRYQIVRKAKYKNVFGVRPCFPGPDPLRHLYPYSGTLAIIVGDVQALIDFMIRR